MKHIVKGKIAKPRRLLVYGVDGVGKTTFASGAPSPIFVQTEDGGNDIGADRFDVAESSDEIIDIIGAVRTGDHEYKTLVLDSVTVLQDMMINDIVQQDGQQSIADVGGGYGRGYERLATKWGELLHLLALVRAERDMAIVLIGHAEMVRVESADPAIPTYDQQAPRLHKKINKMTREWCDDVFFATTKVIVTEHNESFGRKQRKGIDGGRVLKTRMQPAHVAKCRLETMPEEINLDWREYAEHYETKTNNKKEK